MIIKRQFGKAVPSYAQDDRSDDYERWFKAQCREIEQPQPKAQATAPDRESVDYPTIYRNTEAALLTLGRAYTAFGEQMATAIVEVAEQGRRDRNRTALGIFSPASGGRVFYCRLDDESEARKTQVEIDDPPDPPALTPRNRFELLEVDD